MTPCISNVLTYNYEHFSSLYAEGEYFNLSINNRYIPFAENKEIVFNMRINNIKYKHAKIKSTSINHETGSVYDISTRLGIQGILDPEQIEILKNLTHLASKYIECDLERNELLLTTTINPLEVKLIEITLK